MLSRASKAAFYACAGPAMDVSSQLYRILRAPRSGHHKVHLGPGQRNYLQGWINVDANVFTGKADVWADLRKPLPFHNTTIDAFYSHHVVEHLPNLASHFAEVARCLKPGGSYRVGVPNGDAAIAMFSAGRSDWFSDFPDSRKSVGGRLENFIFCRGEHLTILTESYLRELLADAGFEDIQLCRPTLDTRKPDLFGECLRLEFESDIAMPHTLLLEATRR